MVVLLASGTGVAVLLAPGTGVAGGARGDFGAGEDGGVRPVRQVGGGGDGGDGTKNDTPVAEEEEAAGGSVGPEALVGRRRAGAGVAWPGAAGLRGGAARRGARRPFRGRGGRLGVAHADVPGRLDPSPADDPRARGPPRGRGGARSLRLVRPGRGLRGSRLRTGDLVDGGAGARALNRGAGGWCGARSGSPISSTRRASAAAAGRAMRRVGAPGPLTPSRRRRLPPSATRRAEAIWRRSLSACHVAQAHGTGCSSPGGARTEQEPNAA